MKAKDVMTTHVVTISTGASAAQAAELMLQHRISGLPVVDRNGNVVGIVTEGDFLRRAELGTERQRPRWLEFLAGPGRLAAEYSRASGRKVDDVMTSDVRTIDEEVELSEVVRMMESYQIKRLPVVRDGKLVGIVSRANLLHALSSLARNAGEAPEPDDYRIRKHILSEFDRLPWAPRAMLNVVVNDGIVELWGSILDERQRQALIIVVENAPGVKAVHDRLVWLDPHSGWTIPPPGTGS
jgi:CBS domain-containing protein